MLLRAIITRLMCDQHAAEQAQASLVKSPWKTLLFERRFRPQLVITVLMPFFQQFTGINAVRARRPPYRAAAALWC